jgi:hypothetical protein
MAIQRVDQGTLNNLRGNLTFESFPELNITASFLTKAGISVRRTGPVVTRAEALTGDTTIPEPYQRVEVTCALNRATSLASDYETRIRLTGLMGNATLKSDSTAFPAMSFINMSISNVGDIALNNGSIDYGVVFEGTYYINEGLFNIL